MKMVASLFLYGAWLSGDAQVRRLESRVRSARPATVRGSVYRSRVGFPLFVNEGDDRIQGSVVEALSPHELFAELDEFYAASGAAFYRTVVDSWDGSVRQPVSIFAVTRAKIPRHWPRIAAGDWQTDLQRRPDLVSQLTPSQRLYLQRLAASNGGENVPADLQLYHELLKHELILDRGRQVALSVLGQELVRYLPRPAEALH